jgi:Na+/melibiose symporter-like transporter
MLFCGRFVQAVANTTVGILGFTNLTKVTPVNGTEKIYGVLTMSMAAGSSGGPLMAGAVLGLAGYWPAWMSAFGACLIGVILQSLMLVPPQEMDSDVKSAKAPSIIQEDTNEQTPLLVPSQVSDLAQLPAGLRAVNLDFQFYFCLLTNRRYIGGILSSICYAIVSVSFDTTLPLHVLDVFNWGSLHTGILFGILQGPNAFFSVPVKWLKDRVGSQYPTTVGFLGLAVLLWLAGTPGNDQFPWANLGYRGPIIYAAAIAAIGIFMTLLNGTGMMEAASKNH